MPGPSRSKKAKGQSMTNARAHARAYVAGDRHSKRAKGSTSDPSPSRVLRVCLDLYIVFVATNDVSGEQLMGDRPADAASAPGELCRIDIVTRDPLSVLLVFFSH